MKLSDSVTLHLPRLWSPQKPAFLLVLLCPHCSVLSQLCPNHSYEHVVHTHNRNPNTVITIFRNDSPSWWLTPASLLSLWILLDDQRFLPLKEVLPERWGWESKEWEMLIHQGTHFLLQQTFTGSMLTYLLPKSALAVCPVCSAGDSPAPLPCKPIAQKEACRAPLYALFFLLLPCHICSGRGRRKFSDCYKGIQPDDPTAPSGLKIPTSIQHCQLITHLTGKKSHIHGLGSLFVRRLCLFWLFGT